MYQIRSWLYIGKYSDTIDSNRLHAHHINAILQFAERIEQPKIRSCYIRVKDGVSLPFDSLRQGIDFILDAHKKNETTLVSCGAGISRSSTFVIAALKELEQLSLFDAFTSVRTRHPRAMPHLELWKSLCDYYQEQIHYHEILKWKA